MLVLLRPCVSSRGVAVSMREAAKPLLLKGFQLWKLEEVSHEMLVLLFPRVSSRVSGFPVALLCLWGKMQNLSSSNVFKQVVMWFCVAGEAICDIPSCLITCRKFQNWRTSRTKCSFCCAKRVLSRVSGFPVASPCLWGKLRNLSFSKVFKQVAMSFWMTGVAFYDAPTCFIPCRKFFCVAGAAKPSTLYTLNFTLYTFHCILYTPHSTLHRTLHFIHSNLPLCTPHFTLYTLYIALYTPHFTLLTPHSTLYTLHSTLYTLHSTLYTLYTLHTLHFTHSTRLTPHFILHTPHFTLHTPHFPLHTLYSALYTPHSTLYTLHSTLYTLYTPHSTLYTPHSLLYTFHSTLYTFHCTLHTPHSTLHTTYTPHSPLHTLHSTLLALHSTLHTPHSTLSTPHSTHHSPTPHCGLVTGEICIYIYLCTRLFKSTIAEKSSAWLHVHVFRHLYH